MARLETYLTPVAVARSRKTIHMVNALQLTSSTTALVAFLLSVVYPDPTVSAYVQFSLESRTAIVGLYIVLGTVPIVLSTRKNLEETSLIICAVLSIVAFATGPLVIVVIFQSYSDLTLPLFFTAGFLVNVPVLVGRFVPLTHIWHRKRRGISVGHYGNLGGILIEMHVTKLKTLVVYGLLIGIPSSILLPAFILQAEPDKLFGDLFVVMGAILACVAILGVTLIPILKERTGWQRLILDTYENGILWWYDSRGSLVSIHFPTPYVTSIDNNNVKLSMVRGGASTVLKFYSSSDLDHFMAILNPTRQTF